MAHYIASDDTIAVLKRLSAAITEGGFSLRGLERESERLGLADHETLRHGNLSRALRGLPSVYHDADRRRHRGGYGNRRARNWRLPRHRLVTRKIYFSFYTFLYCAAYSSWV